MKFPLFIDSKPKKLQATVQSMQVKKQQSNIKEWTKLFLNTKKLKIQNQ